MAMDLSPSNLFISLAMNRATQYSFDKVSWFTLGKLRRAEVLDTEVIYCKLWHTQSANVKRFNYVWKEKIIFIKR